MRPTSLPIFLLLSSPITPAFSLPSLPTTLTTNIAISLARIHSIPIPPSLLEASALNIDVWGPIPDDAVRVPLPNSTDLYGFLSEPGTRANVWARAQGELDKFEEELRRWEFIGGLERRQRGIGE